VGSCFRIVETLPPIVVYFVVVKDGREIHGVVEGAAITFVAYRVD